MERYTDTEDRDREKATRRQGPRLEFCCHKTRIDDDRPARGEAPEGFFSVPEGNNFRLPASRTVKE